MTVYNATVNTSAWQGDWHARIYSHLEESGFDGLLDYLRSHPGTWYVELARDLGSDIVGEQVVATIFKEARAKGQLRWAAMDCLVRHIRYVFQNGWGKVYIPAPNSVFPEESARRLAARPLEENIRFHKADAFGGCIADIKHVPVNVRSLLLAVRDALERFSPPVGWLPEAPDDPYIVAAFDEGWPPSTVVEYLPVGPHALCPKCTAVLSPPGEEEIEQTCPNCGTAFPLFSSE